MNPSSETQVLDQAFIELNEQRPPARYQLADCDDAVKPTLKLRLDDVMRDARLGSYHVMIILADYTDQASTDFVDEELLDLFHASKSRQLHASSL